MSPEQLWRIILTGYSIEKHKGTVYRFYIPTLEVEHNAQIYSISAINLDELPDRKDLDEVLNEILTEEEITFYEEYHGNLKEKEIVRSLAGDEHRRKLIDGQIEDMKSKYDFISTLRSNVFRFSSETIRSSIELDYYFYWGVRRWDGESLWSSLEEYENSYVDDCIELQSSYSVFLNKVYREENIRSVAKLPKYRVRIKSWSENNIRICECATKTTEPLSSLLYWCQLYNNVITNTTEEIPKGTIEDNKRFDVFVDHIEKKYKSNTSGSLSNEKNGSIVSVPIIGQ